MNSAAIREAFLAYFEKQGHARVTSSSLVPGNDPTLLFTNAGMVQFKDVFLGSDRRTYSTATSSQRCVRAGGKHNDLENVGYTARHHTFFEMLGNFSFGDYFKREAIQFAWQFLTEELGLPKEKLWITVHISDDEAADIWLKELGVSADRFSRLDEDNFWQMGDTGPCGPSSEIFYDHGENVAGDPPGGPNDDGDRYIEIWNLVFMQFERSVGGELNPLPNPSIDTGMGLERIAAVMQGVHNNYEIDLFQHLLKAASALTQCKNLNEQSLRVIADHIRSCAFLIVDGVVPGNEGRGYVLRRIMRRAIRHGNKLGAEGSFFYKLVQPLVEEMGDAYPELRDTQKSIEKTILIEEQQFARTLDNGMAMLNAAIDNMDSGVLAGELVFKLYDTYGFPVDLTNDIARERGISLDHDGFEKSMAEQKRRSQAAGSFSVDYTQSLKLDEASRFVGYTQLQKTVKVTHLLLEGKPVDAITGKQEAIVVLDETPFYAESGGQIGDAGLIEAEGLRFEVQETTKAGQAFLHKGVLVSGVLSAGQKVQATVDDGLRQATKLNHSATHLLHAALRQILGAHVTQKGSLVDSEKLRFDFSHSQAVTHKELNAVQTLVNEKILANSEIETEEASMEEAKAKGAMALFGEKYGDSVRVLSMAEGFSVELCGGTHADRTGDIGQFMITAESGVAAGVRRIEAVTARAANKVVLDNQLQLRSLQSSLKATPANLSDKLAALLDNQKALEKEVDRLKASLASSSGKDLSESAIEINGINVLMALINGADTKALRISLDQLKNKLGKAVIVLAGVEGEKVSLVAGVTKAETDQIKAGDVLRGVASHIGGKGGGKPDMAQGGGGNAALLNEAFEKVTAELRNTL